MRVWVKGLKSGVGLNQGKIRYPPLNKKMQYIHYIYIYIYIYI